MDILTHGAPQVRKQGFTAAQRWAVWIVHGEKCYLDGHPIDLQSMQVDHIIPESLAEEPERLTQVLHDFGLPSDFDLNSYENWMPACGTHNNFKRAKVFTPTPLIQMYLEKAAEKAEKAREIEQQSISKTALAKASNLVMREAEALGISTEDFVAFLNQLIDARERGGMYMSETASGLYEEIHFSTRMKIASMIISVPISVIIIAGFAIIRAIYDSIAGGLLFVCVAIAVLLVFLLNLDVRIRLWIYTRFPALLEHRKVNLDLPEIDDELLRAILQSKYNNDDIQLTPTMSISFERALELTGRLPAREI
ncbi:HNH endonuclease [Rhizobium phaseoli]|uniref:HNH endonuclease signature motif containing protein n=1 Tax=Rhizobium phaseoli TaxID=396 RepID=UPI0003748B7F|nr:HNH endonuclease signature motif containing protein [Rhizobium phaseoli]RDJ13293.1 HNH endonuclease [Rhizobium phaseoli]RDJ16435.1 HNH endonuclease [Rhizobium phaseoli]